MKHRNALYLAAGILSLASWQALAADTAAPADAAAPGPMHEKGDHWKKIDTNGDGVISHDEFMANSETRFKEMDTNGDGKLSKEELQAHREKMRERFKEMREHRMEMKKEKAAGTDTAPKADGK